MSYQPFQPKIVFISAFFLYILLSLCNKPKKDQHESEAHHDSCELEQTMDVFLPLSVEDLEHDNIEESPCGHTLQSSNHNLRYSLGTGLADGDPYPDTEGADQAEYGKVGVEDGCPGA